uniref:RRM domain-containing protein n=1 Tax=Nelumbo nucifera TaxID=4432 RepID=A0A822Z7G8_NELNU|nr:TPA_asm: hypothetical protein HUJ06_015345 [Nelumbo nucifera]
MALRLPWLPSTLSGDQHCRTALSLQIPFQTKLSFSTSSISPGPGLDFLPNTTKTSTTGRRRTNLISCATEQQDSPLASTSTVTVESPVSGADGESVIQTRLIAQNVPWTCTSEDIRNLFEKHGTVEDVELSMHNKTRNRGLAFVTMGSEEEALAALTNLEAQEFQGRVLKVNYAKSLKKKPSVRPEPVIKHNVFVGNLSWRVRSRDLREFFGSGTGNVVSAEVIFQSNPRKSTGYGFVSFSSPEEAEAAISAFSGKVNLILRITCDGLAVWELEIDGKTSSFGT